MNGHKHDIETIAEKRGVFSGMENSMERGRQTVLSLMEEMPDWIWSIFQSEMDSVKLDGHDPVEFSVILGNR